MPSVEGKNAGNSEEDVDLEDDNQEVARVLSVREKTSHGSPSSTEENEDDVFTLARGQSGYSVYQLAISIGNPVTDILQGVYLIYWHNDEGQWALKTETWHYGLWVLIVCWVPGLVCVVHILAHYRSYQLQSQYSLNIQF